jgi:hypothetical protein
MVRPDRRRSRFAPECDIIPVGKGIYKVVLFSLRPAQSRTTGLRRHDNRGGHSVAPQMPLPRRAVICLLMLTDGSPIIYPVTDLTPWAIRHSPRKRPAPNGRHCFRQTKPARDILPLRSLIELFAAADLIGPEKSCVLTDIPAPARGVAGVTIRHAPRPHSAAFAKAIEDGLNKEGILAYEGDYPWQGSDGCPGTSESSASPAPPWKDESACLSVEIWIGPKPDGQ